MIELTTYRLYDYAFHVSREGILFFPVCPDRYSRKYDVYDFHDYVYPLYKKSDLTTGQSAVTHVRYQVTAVLLCCYISTDNNNIDLHAFEQSVFAATFKLKNTSQPIVISKRSISNDFIPCLEILNNYFEHIIVSTYNGKGR